MKNQLLKFLAVLLPLTLFLFIAQYLLINFALEEYDFFYPTYAIYLFHFFATFLIYLILVLIYHNFRDKTGFAFMGASFLKMLAAIIFLLPMLLNHTGNAFGDLLSFFVPYFLYLVFETFYAVRLINAK
ncbi:MULTISPECIES: hypothetical protein [Antarcticibacterium]|nr:MULTISPECIES: hypothetical protein [Antarcticibacterium]